jgi:biopolymer transport protein ExbD
VAKIVSVIIPMVLVTMIVLGIILLSATSSAYAQINATTSTNQTGKTVTPSKQASESIRGAITSTGQFLQNATQKIAGSKSAQTIVNESSGVLGNTTVAIKKYFGSK